jgi:Na+/melibiose symporter-like transporter
MSGTMRGANRLSYAAYGLLGLPLAMSALPIYIQAPAYYTGHLGLALAGTGWVLFLSRLVDTLQDPWLGRCIDRLHGMRLKVWLMAAALLLALAFFGLWLPPTAVRGSSAVLLAWLGAMLIVTYTAHSMLNIAYLAWGARLSQRDEGLLGASALRELAGLAGAVVASVAPAYIFAGGGSVESPLSMYALGFAICLAIALAALLLLAPPWNREGDVTLGWREVLTRMQSNRSFRRLLLPYFFNAVSVAIPATLALFFINDRLQASQYAGAFLALYFLSTAFGLPLWVALAKRLGVLQAWRSGMLLAIVAFGGAALLQAGDVWLYASICIAAGLALGADLALPPVLLAGVIGKNESPAAYYGVWTLLAKLALAVSGLALPLLAVLGYQPGMGGMGGIGGITALGWVYAAVPCLFKLLALLLLRSMPTFAPDHSLLETPS